MAKPTQTSLVMQYIHDFGSITTWQAYQDLGVSRLASRIFDLKKQGYTFRKERVQTRNRYNKPCHYDKYFLVG